MSCERHSTTQDPCYVCKLEVEVSRIFATELPRYRYWRIKRSPGKSERTFEYTTETAEQGKYWAVERRWVKTARGERGKIVRTVGFKQRNKAKARAYEWYQKAQPKAVTAV